MQRKTLILAIQLGIGFMLGEAALAQDVELSSLGSAGFRLEGMSSFDQSGWSVSRAGDVNGDGLDDMIIGAWGAYVRGYAETGHSYVVFGKTDINTVQLGNLAGTGFRIQGANFQDRSGYSVSDAGDVNGDGFDDLVIGAIFASPGGVNRAGAGYVVFGKNNSLVVELSNISAGSGFAINGANNGANLGFSVSGAGDVNGDGLDDVILGAPKTSSSAGEAYVVFGKADSLAVEVSNLGAGGFSIQGADAVDEAGNAVGGAGDVNNDGLDDVIIGAPRGDPGGNDGGGESYVVFGKADSATVALSNLGALGFRIDGAGPNESSGSRVDGAGDVNGDGLDDLVLAAPGAAPGGRVGAGAAFVVFGKTDLNPVQLSALGPGGFQVNGVAAADVLGSSVAGAGDVNGDGLADVILSADRADPDDRSTAGESYVVFGRTATTTIELSALGARGFAIMGSAVGDQSGTSVSGAGDINGDGADDVIIGAYAADPGGRSLAGESYLILGTPMAVATEQLPAPMGLDAGDLLGSAVSISGNRFAVGIPAGGTGGAGQVAVYYLDGQVPVLDQLIEAPAAMAGLFGGAIALEGDRLLVGAGPQPATKQTTALQAALFQRVNQDWRVIKDIVSPAGTGDAFGSSVAISGDLLLIGAPGDAGGDGAAYLFSAVGETIHKYGPPVGGAGHFGAAVAASSGQLAIGAPTSALGQSIVGSLTIVDQIAENLIGNVRGPAFPSRMADRGRFGAAVAIDNGRVIVGAPGEAGGRGAAYRFDITASQVAEVRTISPSQLIATAGFGSAVAIGGDQVLIGAPGEGPSGGAFLLDADLSGPSALGAEPDQSGFGTSVAIDDNGGLLVGAPQSQSSTGAASYRVDGSVILDDGFE